jgi:hypothetical protein
MITIYWAPSDGTAPVTMQVERLEYSKEDPQGHTMYRNSHFLDEADAWRHIMSEHDAHLIVIGRDIEDAKIRLRELEKRAGTIVQIHAKALDNYADWKRRQEAKP